MTSVFLVNLVSTLISVDSISKCYSGCCSMVVWLIKVCCVSQHLCLQHSWFFQHYLPLAQGLYTLPWDYSGWGGGCLLESLIPQAQCL